uniref:Uncharacterized protein n=1 Tax=Arundo donax TaxID=35708 RepID=A0A0A9AGF5_ARUDO
MFSPGMKDRICSKIGCTNIITPKTWSSWK